MDDINAAVAQAQEAKRKAEELCGCLDCGGGPCDWVMNLPNAMCCDWWTEGCGCGGSCAAVGEFLDVFSPCFETAGTVLFALAGPWAFPLVFCFPADDADSSGWKVSVLQAPCVRPCSCCFASICMPCGQFEVRRRALGGDLGRYKLWQGYHDGPHCCAVVCPSMPITIEAGTYNEASCPALFLCCEVTCLGGACSPCCAFDVSRRLMRDERCVAGGIR